MSEEKVEGYNLTHHELDLERGFGADPEEVKKQADLISEKWATKEPLSGNQVVLILGGFQGSGKTTTLDHLVENLGLVIISPDEIRHNLFTQQYPFSNNFVKLVSATKFELVKRALGLGLPIAIDQALTPDRIKITKEILADHPEYHLISVFLSAPKETLIKRVSERPQLPGRYRGTVPELESSMNKYLERYGSPKQEEYDLIIDTTQSAPQEIAEIIKGKLGI